MEVLADSIKYQPERPEWPRILKRLIAGDAIDFDAAYAAMSDMLSGETPLPVAAGFLVALRAKGETAEEMAGLATAMADFATPVHYVGDLVDTCGTGGDQKHSVNISTMAALVVAASGAKVCKHGNRAASSMSGSADVLEYLGVKIDLGANDVLSCIEETNIGFCLAPRFHGAMAHVMPVQRALAVPTAFNFLGPLVNPARANRQLVGVFEPKMARIIAEVLAQLGSEHALVAYSADGFDELSTTSINTVIELRRTSSGEVRFEEYQLDPRDFGFKLAVASDMLGGDPAKNGEVLLAVLRGGGGSVRDMVLLNAGAALYVAGQAGDIATGIEKAREILSSDLAAKTLENLVAVSRRLGS